MTTIKLNGRKYVIPSSWHELKTRQYIRILKEWEPEKDIADRDYYKLLNIMVDEENVYINDVDNQIALVSILGWVVTEPFRFDTELPKALQIGDKQVSIPKDPRELSIGQNIHLRRHIEKCKILEESISMAIGIYLQPTLDNKLFHVEQAQHYARKIDEMPIAVTYPIGFFLLQRHLKFGQNPEKTFPLIKTNLAATLRNLWQRWRKSKSYTALTTSK